MNFEIEVPKIERIVRNIEREFQLIKGLILTESDLKCHLYLRLMQLSNYKMPKQTRDEGIYSNSIHSELSWFDENGNLTIKPDITILEPAGLSILRGTGYNYSLPSKQFEFTGKSIIFELKFIRGTSGITKKIFTEKILEDYMKIQGLFNRLDNQGMNNEVFCFFVIFNKTNKVCTDFIEFMSTNGSSNRHKIIYGSGNVDMDNIENNFSLPPDIRLLNKLGASIPFSMVVKNRKTSKYFEDDAGIT
jgi:hypothetical protein